MCLRPAIINQMLRPHATSPGILFQLIPEDAVVVSQASDQIGQPVAIHVFRVDESRRADHVRWLEPGRGQRNAFLLAADRAEKRDLRACAHPRHFFANNAARQCRNDGVAQGCRG